ncbi:MAG: hypothetical protein GY870_16715, partial [archaeon]|nr:hypothetical protein [archaeon]
MNFENYLDKFQKLGTGIVRGHIRPHKPVMILAILSLIENGKLSENRIEYSPQLLELFKRFFDLVKTKDDALNPILPFFHLRGDKFFHHKPFSGKQAVYKSVSSVKSAKTFFDIVEYAYLDDALYHYLQDTNKLNELREILIRKYFNDLYNEVWVLIKEEQKITTYEIILKNGSDKI